jgi:hypothetical protein
MQLKEARERLGARFTLRRIGKAPEFAVRCRYRGCTAAWSISERGLDHPGNVLHLLNHSFGHSERRDAQ